MKKYLCLLCLSTKNHNILCFVNFSGTKFANKGICLWKAPKPLAGRGFPFVKICPKFGATSGDYGYSTPKPKPSPRRGRGQDAETVQIGCRSVEMWRFGMGLQVGFRNRQAADGGSGADGPQTGNRSSPDPPQPEKREGRQRNPLEGHP